MIIAESRYVHACRHAAVTLSWSGLLALAGQVLIFLYSYLRDRDFEPDRFLDVLLSYIWVAPLIFVPLVLWTKSRGSWRIVVTGSGLELLERGQQPREIRWEAIESAKRMSRHLFQVSMKNGQVVDIWTVAYSLDAANALESFLAPHLRSD